MFFVISRTTTDHLPVTHRVGHWIISTDLGWQSHAHPRGGVILSKGLDGNRCEIICDGTDWQIDTDGPRKFPLWHSSTDDMVSNLLTTGTPVHNPHSVRCVGGEVIRSYGDSSTCSVKFTNTTLSRQDVETQLCDNLVKQAQDLATLARESGKTVIAPNSNGADCALVRASLDYAQVPYAEHRISDVRMDTGFLRGHPNRDLYNQLLDEGSPHIQATGYHGDCYMSRNPLYVSLYLADWNIDLVSEFEKAGQSYMRGSFEKRWRAEILHFERHRPARVELRDMLANQFEVWHINDCLTWTPFIDEGILNTCLRLDPETAIDQCINAGLSRSLIKRLSPGRLDEIQKHHNGNLPGV